MRNSRSFLFTLSLVAMVGATCLMIPHRLAAADLPHLVQSQEAPAEGGGSLMERGADLFFRGLREEMGPTLEGLQDLLGEVGPSMGEFLSQMGPALADIARRVEDWSAYELPEMLPNGDIIIRKKPRETPPAVPEGEIEI